MITERVTAFGFDPGLRHGALVRATFVPEGRGAILSDLCTIFRWDKRNPLSLGEKSDPKEVFKLTQHMTKLMREQPVYPLAIDWDPYSVFWRARKLQSVQLALFMGYFSRACHELGVPTVFISPMKVREFLKLPPRAEKEVMQQWFTKSVSITKYPKLVQKTNSDIMDSVILAYLASRSMDRSDE